MTTKMGKNKYAKQTEICGYEIGPKVFHIRTTYGSIGYNSQRVENPESTKPTCRMSMIYTYCAMRCAQTQESIKPNGKLRNIVRYKYRTNSIRNF